MSELTNAPVVETPPIDPWSMPLSDLKREIDQPAQPAPVAETQAPPSQIEWKVNPGGQVEMQLPTGEILRGKDATAYVLRLPAEQRPAPYQIREGDFGVEVNMLTGERFVGKDLTEALGKLAHANFSSAVRIRELKANHQPAISPQVPDPVMQQSTEEAQQEAAQFLRSLVLTPEVRQQIVAEAVGIDPQQLPQTVQEIASTVAEFQANNTMFEFHSRCPDYADTPENARAVTESLASMAGVGLEDFLQSGYMPTVNDLETAYALAVYRGKITPHKQPTQQVQTARPFVMPTAGASFTAPNSDAWNMPLDQLKKAAGLG